MDIRPTTLNEIIGQDNAKTVCKTLTLAAKLKHDAIPHIMFSGPSGNGKTTFARAMAEERGTNLVQTNAAVIKKEADLEDVLLSLDEFDILFIDEIHALPKKVSEFLYTAMEDFQIFQKVGGAILEQEVPKFTLIGATTHFGQVLPPMRNRFKFVAEFVDYTLDELSEIALRVCKAYKFNLNKQLATVIAKTCRLTPRIVVSRTEWIRDYMLANNIKNANAKQVLDIIALQGVDENGLEHQDHKYLKIVEENQPIGVNQICSKMSVDKTTLTEVIEPYLIKSNLVKVEKRGRYLA